jgi:hypothetical protein
MNHLLKSAREACILASAINKKKEGKGEKRVMLDCTWIA